jgi:dienelactone hydrolase
MRLIVFRISLTALLMLLLSGFAVLAQSEESTDVLPVVIEAEDGLMLHGEFFSSPTSNGRAVLLLHQLYTTRVSWYPYIEPLRAAGYHVLAIDLRGYGETGGGINWRMAQADTQQWLAWLNSQPGIRGSGVFVIGSSMGSSLALVGCAEADACAGAVALSPGRRYFGVSTDEAISSGRPALLIYADRDTYPRLAVPHMQDQPEFNGEVITYSGRAHGILLLKGDETLLAQIIAWMNARG